MTDKEKRGDAPVQINNEVFFEEVTRMLSDGFAVTLRVKGSSMFPFLRDGRDRVTLRKTDGVEVGDIVLARLDNGTHVLHRIYKKKSDGYYMAGDAQTQIEGPLRRDQIFALIIKVKRKGKILQPGDFWWEFFEHVWIRIIPLRKMIEKGYSLLNWKKQ